MKQLFSILTVLLLTIFISTQAFAHSYLTGSNPADGEVLTEAVQEITLNFNSKIMEGSFLTIKTVDGEEINVTNNIVGDGFLTGVLAEPLTSNEYIVNWSIISADGHPLEGTYSFTVNLPSVEANEQQPSESDLAEENIVNKENGQKDIDVSDEQSSSLIYIVLAIAAIVFIASFAFILKRKK